MIIEALLNLVYAILDWVLGLFSFPPASDTLTSSFDTFLAMLDYAKTFIPLVLPINMQPYLTIGLALFVCDHFRRPIMWFVNKIISLLP